MIIEGGTIWGEIRGKMSLTPEEAWDLFGFRMKPGAKGVYFRVRRGKQEICNLFPPSIPRTKLQVRAMKRLGTLCKLSSDIKCLIDSCWSRLSLGCFRTGKELFISRNCKLVGLKLKWLNLLVTDGSVIVPDVSTLFFRSGKLFVRVSNFVPGLFLGVCVFFLRRRKMFWLGEFDRGDLILPFDRVSARYIVYLYFRSGSNYSRSVSFFVSNR